jgi:hypothetical protein
MIVLVTSFSTTLLRKGMLATCLYDDNSSVSRFDFLCMGLIVEILSRKKFID